MPAASSLIAMLGPTNTGKTHMAIERMLEHDSGVIGLPLRLLAREVYDRLCARLGAARVALVTGEEKIAPEGARYRVCTVEAMPARTDADFVAIDEVQLAADAERGHVFTDRLLHLRGRRETWLLGAAAMREVLEGLLPRAKFRARPRLSRLTWAGGRKITRLPPRSAVVAFSAQSVYAVAELLRRQKGGAAVVMGALSPRTRNAQVALFQSGDVDYLVATDAIGMGLNMDIDHVAFAATRKFDGQRHRDLTRLELGQIAGRAGRYLDDGTFGVTAAARPFDADTIEALEDHRFAPIRALQWRNRDLSFASVNALLASLRAAPDKPRLWRAPLAADVAALQMLARDDEITARLGDGDRLRLLWAVCQLPDYRNISPSDHARLIGAIFLQLSDHDGVIAADWLARQVNRCARYDGDIDTLSARIAHIRTWSFVANRADWLDDAAHWRATTRAIEDKLSDALHERLTKRFIDRKTAVLLRKLRDRRELMTEVHDDGAVVVEGEVAGRIEGLRFIPEGRAEGAADKAFAAAARTVLGGELSARAQALSAAPDGDFTLTASGEVIWQSAAVARLRPGDDPLKPGLTLLADEALDDLSRKAVAFRLEKFVSRHLREVLAPLFDLREDEALSGLAKGLAFRLVEHLGVLKRALVAEEVRGLDQDTRAGLRRHGVRFGAWHIYIPALLKPAPTALRLLLWTLARRREGGLDVDIADLPPPPGNGLTSAAADPAWPEGFARVAGYMTCGGRVVRIDMLERLGDMIRDRVFWKPRFDGEERPAGSVEGGGITVIPDMMSLIGCSGEEFAAVLETLGYRKEERPLPPAEPEAQDEAAGTGEQSAEPAVLEVWWPDGTGPFRRQRRKGDGGKRRKPAAQRAPGKAAAKPRPARPRRDRQPDPDSPFAVLQQLKERRKDT